MINTGAETSTAVATAAEQLSALVNEISCKVKKKPHLQDFPATIACMP